MIELMIVVAIILIIATFAIPTLLRSRYTANETSAVSSLRVLYGAETQFASNYNSFSGDLNTLGPAPANTLPTAASADLVDQVLSGRISGLASQFQKAGYRFTYTPTGTYPSVMQYTFTADPTVRGNTGQRSFFMDQTGIVRSNSTATATVNDNPI